jgi:hypothetical protein
MIVGAEGDGVAPSRVVIRKGFELLARFGIPAQQGEAGEVFFSGGHGGKQ